MSYERGYRFGEDEVEFSSCNSERRGESWVGDYVPRGGEEDYPEE